MKLSDKVYDICKWFCLVVIPAGCLFLETLNMAFAWNLPMEAIKTASFGAATFLGSILGFSTALYNRDGGSDR